MAKVTTFKYPGIYAPQIVSRATPSSKVFKNPIPLTDIFNIPETRNKQQSSLPISYQPKTPIQEEYKLHTAIRDSKDPDDPQGRDPYGVLMYGDGSEWTQWNRNSPVKSPYNRKYIFSLARMPDTKTKNRWVFGGVFVVQGGPYYVPKGSPVLEGHHAIYRNERFEYDIYQSVWGRHFIGKIEIAFKKPPGIVVRFPLEDHIKNMKITEIYS